MSKDFEEKVLKKLSELDKKVSRIDVIEEKLSEIDEIKEKVSRIDAIEEKVSRIDAIEDKLDKLDDKVERINKSVIIIEEKVSNEIPGLFDGYTSNYDLQKEAEKRITSLEQENFYNSIRISNLEIATKKRSKKIKS